MNDKKVSMKEIANLVGVSIVSVSKAINNQMGVSDDLRKKILDTAFDLGYLTQKREHNTLPRKFAYITPTQYYFEKELFYTLIFYHLNEKCMLKNISLSLFIINPDDEKQLMIPTMINSGNFDGIFIGGEMNSQYIHSLQNLNLPTVCIDFYKPDLSMDCVIVNNFYASFDLTVYLIRNGHKKVGFIRHPLQTSSVIDRYFGYQKALYQYGLEYKQDWNMFFSDKMVLPADMPTAYVCHNDKTAVALLKTLQANGYRVPDDVSLVSFDNHEVSSLTEPPITTVDINRESIAEKAMEQIMFRINHPGEPYQRFILETKLIYRESVKKIGSCIQD